MYLGDGLITRHRRSVYRLRIALDAKYPGIIDECAQSMAAVTPANRVLVQPRRSENCVDVGSYAKQWPCLLPQHGPGPKHERQIVLAPWQDVIIDRHPELLLRGLIHSDGCRSMNRVRRAGRQYAYARYFFTNASDDIRRIFCEACDRVGVEWRQMNARNISVARRGSVARLDSFIGPKR